MRGAMRPPIDHTRLEGLLGAAVGLVLSGALVSAVDRLEDSEPGALWFLGWIVVYPLGAVVGYDLATRGRAFRDHGPLTRVGGYAVALAGAHVFIAALFAVGVGFGLADRSPLFTFAYVVCVVGAGLGRMAALRLASGFHVPAGALIGGSVALLLMSWIAYIIAAGAYLSRIDS